MQHIVLDAARYGPTTAKPSNPCHMDPLRIGLQPDTGGIMTKDDLERGADLAVWPRQESKPPAVAARPFASLREALKAAVEALATNADAWIVTERGDVLSPAWIGAHADAAARC